MSPVLLAAILTFCAVALIAGLLTSTLLTRSAPGRRRLRDFEPTGGGAVTVEHSLTDAPDPNLSFLSKTLPMSPKEMGNLRRQLAAAGYYSMRAALIFQASRFILPVVIGLLLWSFLGVANGGAIVSGLGAVLGYLLPDVLLARKIRQRGKAITNGLPDVLDLMIVCIEAGSSLDQSIVKASDELELAHPALAYELRVITTEIRAGTARLEAFQNFAKRTKVDDVRSLVAILTQADRFGTSVAMARRTQADTSRTKRRQRAEGQAAKVGVKLIFPLALCVFPAVYLVCIGPAVIAIYRTFFGS